MKSILITGLNNGKEKWETDSNVAIEDSDKYLEGTITG